MFFLRLNAGEEVIDEAACGVTQCKNQQNPKNGPQYAMHNRALLGCDHVDPVAIDVVQILLILDAFAEVSKQSLVIGEMFERIDGVRSGFFGSSTFGRILAESGGLRPYDLFL